MAWQSLNRGQGRHGHTVPLTDKAGLEAHLCLFLVPQFPHRHSGDNVLTLTGLPELYEEWDLKPVQGSYHCTAPGKDP